MATASRTGSARPRAVADTLCHCTVREQLRHARYMKRTRTAGKSSAKALILFRNVVVPKGGIEPPTRGFSIRCVHLKIK